MQPVEVCNVTGTGFMDHVSDIATTASGCAVLIVAIVAAVVVLLAYSPVGWILSFCWKVLPMTIPRRTRIY